jgi:hypothetical protein
VIDFETQERQDEIFALVKMMQYADAIACDLGASQAACHVRAAQAAFFSILEKENPVLSKNMIAALTRDVQGHC